MSVKAGSSTPNGSQTFDAIYPGRSQKLALTTSAAKTPAVFLSTTSIIVVCSDSDAFIAIGPTPTATLTTGVYLPAKVPQKFAVNGGTDFLSGISASTGNLYITEGA